MKYISEYRDPELAKQYLEEIKKTVSRPWSIMEVCGGQTHSLVKNGIIDMLPDDITMIHGPGCPVCVTPLHLIDKAIHLALDKNVILCSFGDMLRVPGSEKNLLEAKAQGGDVRVLYSPLEAVKIAEGNPDKEVVFFAVGFETTAPANALSVIHADRKGLKNYSILASHVLVPPAIKAVIDDEESKIDGFLAAGHVCTIMGNSQYHPLSEVYKVPIVVTGFEPLDVLQGILMVIRQLEQSVSKVENQYARIVREQGNPDAQKVINQIFEVKNQVWRGIGEIPESGFQVRPEFAQFDANKKFNIQIEEAPEHPDCISGQIMKGLKKPFECAQFGKKCTPTNPLGAPMVSSEGACAAYYHFSGLIEAS
ncbi:hydrogenase formation protein HypD [Spongiivirga sp. MCCC 1A20706]|uniref:hydrogenase formation protein HypD n=1 Tax=Spongiivirga sp. MCCC 1A20706 TaxID=3160963 RepID=UPI0039779922